MLQWPKEEIDLLFNNAKLKKVQWSISSDSKTIQKLRMVLSDGQVSPIFGLDFNEEFDHSIEFKDNDSIFMVQAGIDKETKDIYGF